MPWAADGSIRGRSRVLELLGILLQTFGHAHEQGLQTLRHRRMRKHGASQNRVGHARQHRELNRTHKFAGLWPKGGESENAIAICVDERLHEPAFLGNSPSPPGGVEWHGSNPVCNAFFPRL